MSVAKRNIKFCRGLAVVLALWHLIFSGIGIPARGAVLRFEIKPKFAGEKIETGALRYQTSAGEAFSFTRVSFLLGDFALERLDGSWLEISNSVAWLDAGRERNSFQFDGIPAGRFRAVRFAFGVNTNLNHADVAQFPPDHPLNPNLNGLHWSWQGGYVFLALEGLWRNSSGELDGWSYHLARDTNRARVNIKTLLVITNQTRLELDFDLAMALKAPLPLSFARDGSSTHSRDGDPVSSALKANLPGALRLRRVSVLTEAEIAATNLKPLNLPATFARYELQKGDSFPQPALPADNPLIAERIALGERLFNDTSLSRDGTISCASCHRKGAAFSDPRRFSVGCRDKPGSRHSMPLFNLAWKNSLFWDGRASSLREQVLMPIQDPTEMDEKVDNVIAKLGNDTNYPAAFSAAFGSPNITAEKIALALENYLLTLTSYDSKFDHVLRGQAKFTAEEKRGFELFSTEYDPRRGLAGADCFHCHGGMLFQSQAFANNGLDSEFTDVGRARVTTNDFDRGKFAVPSLRNVEVTAPYMHDGRFKTLEEVVEHYATGVKRSATLDPNIAKHPDGGVPLAEADKQALVAFLKTLTDERFVNPAD